MHKLTFDPFWSDPVHENTFFILDINCICHALQFDTIQAMLRSVIQYDLVIIASDKDCLFIVICRICWMFNNNFIVEDWESLFKIDYLLIKSTHWLDLYNFVDHLTMLKQSQCTCHSNNTFEVDAPKFESIFLRESSDA